MNQRFYTSAVCETIKGMKYNMNNKVVLIALILSTLIPGTGFAQSSGARKITSVGCHIKDNTCFVTIDGDPVGPDSCKSNSVRWNSDTNPNGKLAYSSFQAATVTKQQIYLEISTVCYIDQPLYPTFLWYSIPSQ